MSERMCRFDPGSGYKDSLIIAWLWGYLFLAGCTKGVLFREKSQRKVKNPAKFCVGLQGLRTQNDRASLPVPAPSPMSNQTGLAKNLHLLHSYISDHLIFHYLAHLLYYKKSRNYDCSSCGCCIFVMWKGNGKYWHYWKLVKVPTELEGRQTHRSFSSYQPFKS